MSVNSHLTQLASNLVLSENEKSGITTSINTLSSRLNSHFAGNISNQFQFGSSIRGTMLPRKADNNSDIDYMVVFNTSINEMTPQTYLNHLRRFAETKYSTSEIFPSHPTIVLSLNHIKFELVPAIKTHYGYQIPSPTTAWSKWMDTNPTGTNQSIQDKNKAENFHIKPLIRLIKYWNAIQGYPFTSFSIEQLIVGKYFGSCLMFKDYFYAFWSGFSCSYDTPQYIKDKVERAKTYAMNAQKYENDNMPACAESEIRKIVPIL
jgi:predicted nucleotidyltransferase